MMITRKFRKGMATIVLSALITLMSSQSALAAPGTLATAPLFLSTIVEPNVFFTLDDSGSMGWNTMVQNGAAGFYSSSGVPYVDNRFRYYYHPDWFTDTSVLPPESAAWAAGVWTLRNHNGNKNYYNPATTYTPWAGVNADGSAMYADANPLVALRNPNSPGGANTNLTTRKDFFDNDNCNCWLPNAIYLPSYYVWTDTDSDGVIETTDSNTLVEIAAGTTQMQNFANWFVYYRNREFSAKAAIGRVINNTDATRMGLVVFNGSAEKDLASMTDSTKKRELLETYYGASSRDGTPARNTLKRVGEMFKSTATDAPILSAADGGECQQNFNIIMTDGFWNGGNPGVGDTDTDGSGIVNNGFDGTAFESIDNGNYGDGFSDTLADVAMKYYEEDLRTDLGNQVPKSAGIDEADHQHLVTYSIAFGLNGSLDSNVVSPLDTGFSWPQPVANRNTTIDDLWHAAYNGRGNYLTAQNPDELEQALNNSISDIAERTASAAAVSINSAKLTTDSVVFLAEFNSNRWQGNLFAFKIVTNPVTGRSELAATADWDAGSELNTRNFGVDTRVVLTHNGDISAAQPRPGVAFQWANLSTAQQDDLKTSPSGVLEVAQATSPAFPVANARLEYLRGDRSNEGTGQFFRERASLLGDLVNSGPVFVGAPSLTWPDAAPFPTTDGQLYSDFKNGPAKTRSGIVYVGANDGMLHGFSETNGREVLAYIPEN
ncbi:MAG: type IV pilus assembly protein PilY1, partial [Gammaproteobacteria bacterium]